MRVEIEPSGCTERRGLVQIRFAMYLSPSDYGYDVHHVQVPGRALTQEELDDPTLGALVPLKWQTNPFHNHFIYVEPDTPDNEIMDIGEAFLHEAYTKWASDEKPDLKNPPVAFPATFDSGALATRVQHRKATKLERKV
ncbi:hypothetical protein LCGC14_2361100 [marine sediment metagenome]|uniref:Uncharacterized protein n=1 Tax=marine sediment metagenome TaxID=412755 RepID=A0A0F9F1F8_9ZZZZ